MDTILVGQGDTVDQNDLLISLSAFVPPARPINPPSPAAFDEAEEASRRWTSKREGPWRLGSEAHKQEVCRMFRETFNPYRPSVIAWPALSAEERKRVTGLPIWDIAVQTEGKARLSFAAYGMSVADPDIRAAIMLNAWEENRHKEVLSKLVEAYGIPLVEEPPFELPRDREWAFLVTGYSECIDSFFAFGLFDLARQSGFFPAELVETFEPVVQEECRHILLFANLLAWHRANLPWWRRLHFELRIAAVWAYIAWQRIGLARTLDTAEDTSADKNFTVNNASAVSQGDLRLRDLLAICLRENDRRFEGYDRRLVRPTTVPKLVRLALRLTGPWARFKHRPEVRSETPL